MHAPKRRGEKIGKISKRPLAPWIHESRQPRMYSTRTSRRGIGKQSESAQDSTTYPSQLECVRPGFQKRPCESKTGPQGRFRLLTCGALFQKRGRRAPICWVINHGTCVHVHFPNHVLIGRPQAQECQNPRFSRKSCM